MKGKFNFASLKTATPEPSGMKAGGKNARGGKKRHDMPKVGRGKSGRGGKEAC